MDGSDILPAASSKMIRTVDGDLVSVTASRKEPAPEWAVLQRQLIDSVNEAAPLHVGKYTEPGGVPYYADDVDDLYEMFYNWGLFYALGGSEELLTIALQEYNAVTRFCDDGIVSRRHPGFGQQLHNEYYNDTEWHHQSEGNMLFYDFGVASPAISENVRRARRFAAMFTGEDPQAPNYDRRRRILRSPVTTSRGPRLQADRHLAKTLLTGRDWEKERFYGVRASLHPHVGELDLDWDRDPRRRPGIVRLVGEVVLGSDVPPEHGGHRPGDQRLPLHRRGEVPAVGARLRRGLAGAGAEETAASCRTTSGPPG